MENTPTQTPPVNTPLTQLDMVVDSPHVLLPAVEKGGMGGWATKEISNEESSKKRCITNGTLALFGGVKKPVLVRTTSIFPSLQLVVHFTPVCLLPFGGKTVMPIFHFGARQAFSPFRCAFLRPPLELFHYDASLVNT